MRLRLKGRSGAGKIFEERKTIKALVPGLCDGKEVLIQAIPAPEAFTVAHRPILIQRWNPATQKLTRKVEIIVGKNEKGSALRRVLATLSGIEPENLGISKGPSLRALKVADARGLKFSNIRDDKMLKTAPLNLRDGNLLVYTDVSIESDGAASTTPKKSVARKPNARFRAQMGAVSTRTASRPKEVALKIHH